MTAVSSAAGSAVHDRDRFTAALRGKTVTIISLAVSARL
jgi:hypothetical protein